MNDTPGRRIDTGTLFWGLALMAVGIIFLLDRLGMADVRFVLHQLWPLLIILMGIARLFRRQAGAVWGALWFISLGVWLQISVLHLFGMTFNSSWPLLMIVLGAGLILRSLADAARARRLATATEERHEP